MSREFCGLERRLDELNARLGRLEELAGKEREDFTASRDLRDIAERNFQVAAQCCIDIANRIVSLKGASKPSDYYEGIIRLGELGVLSPDLAHRLAPLAGFRNILVHEYGTVDWDEVYAKLQRVSDLREFAAAIARWMRDREKE